MAGTSDRFRVDLELLDEAIASMEMFGNDVDTWLTDVDRHIAGLHLSWLGDAATAQRTAHAEWLTGVRRMRDNLNDLRDIATRAHGNYSDAVGTNTRMWPK
jgi:WXG100 family type VII secretion target